MAIHSAKSKLTLNRPIYVGQSVLDNSKLCVSDFWYKQIKVKYGEKANMLHTDTDSLLFQVENEVVYKDMRENGEENDFSHYPKQHAYHCTTNKKVVGKFKDECCGRPIAKFVGLRPKMYSILGAASLEKNPVLNILSGSASSS